MSTLLKCCWMHGCEATPLCLVSGGGLTDVNERVCKGRREPALCVFLNLCWAQEGKGTEQCPYCTQAKVKHGEEHQQWLGAGR